MKKNYNIVKKLFLKSDFAHKQHIKKIEEFDNLFDMGMDSLFFISFLVTLEKKFNITFEIDDFYYENMNTLKKIADACEHAQINQEK